MAELKDARREQFAKLLAAGVRQGEAYGKAGYRTGDRSNASKLAATEEIRARVDELRQEEERRLAMQRGEIGERSGLDELKAAIIGAAASGNWAAVVSGSKVLGEADGSFSQVAPDRQMTGEEFLAWVRKQTPREALGLMIYGLPKISFDPPPAEDIDLVIAGLESWFRPAQLRELGQRLVSAK